MPETRPLAIYVHWPFCQAKCPYCDFNSHVVPMIDHAAWREAYSAEIERYAAELPDGIVHSVFFGGGTPSLMDPATVATVLDGIGRRFRLANDVEVTLEANPTSVEADRFRAYRHAGVNRVSMGIQALRDPALRRLGRLHTVAEAKAAFDIARKTFDRVSFDLIYARQDQSTADWEAELEEALAMASDHLSLYQLSVEPQTAFGRLHAAGALRGLPDEDLSADLYELTQCMTEAAGMPAYEVSNHAGPGARSRHNMTYWEGRDYIGIGPGAHGRITDTQGRIATEAVAAPLVWLAGVRRGADYETRTRASPHDVAVERLLMGLRVVDGVPMEEIACIQGIPGRIDGLAEMGLVEIEAGRLIVTARGKPLLNAILRELLA